VPTTGKLGQEAVMVHNSHLRPMIHVWIIIIWDRKGIDSHFPPGQLLHISPLIHKISELLPSTSCMYPVTLSQLSYHHHHHHHHHPPPPDDQNYYGFS